MHHWLSLKKGIRGLHYKFNDKIVVNSIKDNSIVKIIKYTFINF